ncbi:MAG TPA: glutaredoxin family protein [Elusimicrobia bacterium]|nr:MAG: NrdH-redoxin [Elusimicrobia bacterium RIFOXYA1_FULL_47_7]OGS11627.1 MAG: NrdH-redoxin [Elusimicrobia bacterium RIFOXYB1_FULL_48_9]OGS15715.1 MAG: NrdH-redoxin [Elusimicrobia bacterium RIFOXYA2_FULL_47_53]OGS27066.1 MAG: NrdH-redoxin [Elusimicrobia bacterium RIFOXYB12_FULL_50_12]OGS31016.1 MAG: NrdH-redoxin [Elusimicrobia bacterium RIFOXYB2_FULL_46_23]HBU70477.1 glutaredoxin family protein [Elusimicrobiota bacterium]
MNYNHVKGKNKGEIVIYALSTCVWCKKTKKMLNDMGIEYYFVDVDTLSGEERREAQEELGKWNPSGSFPTVVIGGEKCIVGYDPDKIKKGLGHGK